MVIVGNGQITKKFNEENFNFNCILFASGVSDSKCNDPKEFNKERELLSSYLDKAKKDNLSLIYFSSCALSAENYHLNSYYEHKKSMETLISSKIKNYYIFRIPQLFSEIKKHPTIINFFYYSILEGNKFELSDEAYRYVIDIEDMYFLINSLIKVIPPGVVLDIANPYRYNVRQIISILEKILNKKANYTLIKKNDGYKLNFTKLEKILNKHNIIFNDSGENYLEKKLKKRINDKVEK